MEVSLVKLRNSYQKYFVDTNNLFVKQNAMCIVETEHGVDMAKVVKSRNLQCCHEEINGKLLRKVSEDDLKMIPEIEKVEEKAYSVCKEKAKKKNLDMKLISVKCLFDKTKIIFYFVAENRIDFRELVRELAAVFKTRIEMRQIGVRDEAKIVGGYGPCGKHLCCACHGSEFEPVSIKMAKEQNLNLNSLKISGMCGRLLCCLSYEYEIYQELNRELPPVGSKIYGDQKTYIVHSVDTLRGVIKIHEGDRWIEIAGFELDIEGDTYHIKEEVIHRIDNPDDEQYENEKFVM